MKLSLNKRVAFIATLFFMFFFPTLVFANFIYKNENIISSKAVPKIEEMGSELFQKTGVKVYLIALQSLDGKKIKDYEREISKNFNPPFVLLCFALKDRQVDIFSSEDIKDKFDKEGILSPFTGSIIPLLVAPTKKDAANENDKYTVALFNGYADIIEQIANSYGVELVSAIGNTNRDMYHFLKMIFYGSIIFFILLFLYYKFRGKKNG